MRKVSRVRSSKIVRGFEVSSRSPMRRIGTPSTDDIVPHIMGAYRPNSFKSASAASSLRSILGINAEIVSLVTETDSPSSLAAVT